MDGGTSERLRTGTTFNKDGAVKGKEKGNGKGKKGSDHQENTTKSGTDGGTVNDKKSSEVTENESGKNDGQTGGSAGGGSGEALLAEVTHLLKSIQGPQLRAYRVCRVDCALDERTLLDGGATHCMRTAERGEWKQSFEVTVQLASEQVEMRMHPTKNTLLVQHAVQPIVPLGKLTLVGYAVKWEDGKIEIKHPVHGKIPVQLQQGCPVVEKKWGQQLMEEVENYEQQKAAVKAVMTGVRDPRTKEDHDALKLKKMFPEVPQEILEKVQGRRDYDPSQLPFNRHRRRQIQLAKTVVINLFAGKDVNKWRKEEKNGVVIVSLDVLSGGDLVKNQHLVGWLQMMAETGRVDLWTAGPPCRTVSVCRNEEDSGPPPVRDREGPGRFGKKNLNWGQQNQVSDDTLMWIRTLWWFRLSHEASGKDPQGKNTEYFLEQPLDPEEWKKKQHDGKEPYPSFMVWPETKSTMEELNMKMIRIDQGALGHATRKPTMLAATVPEIVAINGLKCDSYVAGQQWNGTLEERIQTSKSLAEWAPGLCAILYKAIKRINEQKQVIVKALTAKEKREVQGWQDHYRCGHLPFRNDCPTCLIAAGRSKQHRRVLCPSSYCLSLDIMGPFKEGSDQELNGPRYAMVAVYTVPMAGDGSPLPEGLMSLRTSSTDQASLVEGEMEGEEVQPNPAGEDEDPFHVENEDEEEPLS